MFKNKFFFPDIKPQDKPNPKDFPTMYSTPCKGNLTIQEEFMFTVKKVNETLDRVLHMEDMIRKTLDSYTKTLSADNVAFKDLCVTTYNQFSESVSNEINAFESAINNSIESFELKVKQDNENFLLNFEEFKNTVDSQIEDFVSNINTTFDEYKTAVNNYRDELDDFKSNLSEEMLAHKNSVTEDLNSHKEELNNIYDNFRNAIEGRLTQYNSNYEKSFNDYVTSMNNKLSQMERAFNNNYADFTANINNAITEQNKNIDERIDGQDSVIADNILYMRTNLKTSLSELLQTMKESGEFDHITTDTLLDRVKPFHKYVINLDNTTSQKCISDMLLNSPSTPPIESDSVDNKIVVGGYHTVRILSDIDVSIDDNNSLTNNIFEGNNNTVYGRTNIINLVNNNKIDKLSFNTVKLNVEGENNVFSNLTIFGEMDIKGARNKFVNCDISLITFNTTIAENVIFENCVFNSIDNVDFILMFKGSKFINCKFIGCNVNIKGWANSFINCTFYKAPITFATKNGNTNNFISCYFGANDSVDGKETTLLKGGIANTKFIGGWFENATYIMELDNSCNHYAISFDSMDIENCGYLIHCTGGATASDIVWDKCTIINSDGKTYAVSTKDTTTATNNLSMKFNNCVYENFADYNIETMQDGNTTEYAHLMNIHSGIEGIPLQYCARNIDTDFSQDVNTSKIDRFNLVSLDKYYNFMFPVTYHRKNDGATYYTISFNEPVFISSLFTNLVAPDLKILVHRELNGLHNVKEYTSDINQLETSINSLVYRIDVYCGIMTDEEFEQYAEYFIESAVGLPRESLKVKGFSPNISKTTAYIYSIDG